MIGRNSPWWSPWVPRAARAPQAWLIVDTPVPAAIPAYTRTDHCHHYRKMGQDEAFNQILVHSSNKGLLCHWNVEMLFFNFSMKRVRPKNPHQCFWRTLKLPKMTANHAWASAITIEKMEFPTLEMCSWIQNIDLWMIIYPLSLDT